MSDLTFQIHTKEGLVSTATFEKAFRNALYLVTQFDAGVSQFARGSLNWFVSDLRSNGSMAIDFTSRLKRGKAKSKLPADLAPQITHNLVAGFEQIETVGSAPPFLSEIGLQRVGDLADLLQKDGAVKFSFATETESAEITERTSDNVRKLLPTKRTAFGSAEGKLDAINIHKSHKALLYDTRSKRVITCLFDPLQLDVVKNALGQHVIVRGQLHKNIHGQTVRIVNPSLEILEGKKRFSLPSVGGKPHRLPFENARTTAEYMRRIRGG